MSLSDVDISPILLELETVLVDQNVCASNYAGFDEEFMICAGGDGTGICAGDGGNPLIEQLYDHAFLIGMASFFLGNECGTAAPSYFAKAQPAAGWIQDNVFEV